MSAIQTFTGRLTGNRRDTAFCPKALLLDVLDSNHVEVRAHMWTKLNDVIERIQPQGHKSPIQVSITAKSTTYLKSGEQCTSLEVVSIHKLRKR